MAENANLGIFKGVENNGTSFAPKQFLYQKVAVGMENPKMKSPSQFNKHTGRYCPGNNSVSYTAYMAEMQIWEFSKLSKTMVPPLHQNNLYSKR